MRQSRNLGRNIVQTGFSTVSVYASSLPAGMYLYALVVDNVIIDTKGMTLTENRRAEL